MKKKSLAMLLAVVLAAVLLPGMAFAAGSGNTLPDWYFLFAIFKNVDADCTDNDGVTTHSTCTMTQEEIEIARDNARSFEMYMNSLGVMRAHVEVVEIDAAITELTDSDTGSYLSAAQAAPLLREKVDLDQYDHVTCIYDLNISTGYWGKGGPFYDNGTGYAVVHFINPDYAQRVCVPEADYPASVFVHELLHVMENLSKKWGTEFGLHITREKLYTQTNDNWRECYTDIILNQVEGDGETGTGVTPSAWKCPPRFLRTTRELVVPEGTVSIGNFAFQNLTNLERLTIPGSVASIGKYAFRGCTNLKSVTISNGVTSVEDSAFRDCVSLTGVSIPSSVTDIGYAAFSGCSALTEVTMSNGVTGIGEYAFYECGSLESAAIPDSVTSIGRSAFYNCGSLRGNVTIPAGVTVINDYTFYGCASLESVTISDGVTGIGTWAFGNCAALTGVYLPVSVTSVGYATFWNIGQADVYYGGTQAQWNAIQFDEFNTHLTGAKIHYNRSAGDAGDNITWTNLDGVLTISGAGSMQNYSHPDNDSNLPPWHEFRDQIHTVRIEAGVTGIGSYAFSGCDNLKSVTIPDTVTGIGYAAFYNCGSLASVAVPGSVSSIGDYAFSDCPKLSRATIQSGVTSIGKYAFRGCAALTEVTIPSTVTAIDTWTFGNCTALTRVSLPAGVTSIGYAAFWNTGLKDVYYGGTQAQWNAVQFDEYNASLTGASIHCNSTAFSDVPSNVWYGEAVTWAADKGYVAGTGNGMFTPNRDCTNVEILTFLWNAEGKPEATASPLTVADWAQAPVNWAYEKGIIDNTFQPYDPCTRATTVYYIWLAFGKEQPTGSVSFTDVDKSAAYADAVAWAVGLNIVKGTGDGTYAPDSVCNRSQIATFLHLAYEPTART